MKTYALHCSPRSACGARAASPRRTRSTSTSTTRASPVAAARPRRATTTPSSIVFNPGGIAIARGHARSRSAARCTSREGSYENGDDREDRRPTARRGPSPNLYITSRVHDMVAIGVGLHFPFGLAVSYPEDHRSRRSRRIDLRTVVHLARRSALNLHKQVPGLSIGGGIDIVPSSVELKRDVMFGDTRARSISRGDAVGIGWSRRRHVSPARGSRASSSASCTAARSSSTSRARPTSTSPIRIARSCRPTATISTTITLPQSVCRRHRVPPVSNLELEFDAVWINWTQTFGEGRTTPMRLDSAATASTSDVPQDYKNTVTLSRRRRLPLPERRSRTSARASSTIRRRSRRRR